MKYNGLEVVRGSEVSSPSGSPLGYPINNVYYNDLDLEIGQGEVFRVELQSDSQDDGLNFRTFNRGIKISPEDDQAAMAVRYLREPTKEKGKGRVPVFNIPEFADFLYPHTHGPVAMRKDGVHKVMSPDGFYPIQQDRRLDGGIQTFHPDGHLYSEGPLTDGTGTSGRIELSTNDYKWTTNGGGELLYNREHDYLIGTGSLFGYPGAIEANHSRYEKNEDWSPESLEGVYDGCVDGNGEPRYNNVGDGDPCIFYRGTDSFTPPSGSLRSEVSYTNKLALVTYGEGDEDPGARSYRIEDGQPISSISEDPSVSNWQGLRGGEGDYVLTRNRADDTLGWLDVDIMSYSSFTDYSNIKGVTVLPGNEALVLKTGTMRIYDINGDTITDVSMVGKPEVEGGPTPVEGRSVENPEGWGLL